MTWSDLITTAGFLLLCAIAYGVYGVKKAIEDMYSGLGQLLGEHREITKKILFQLDSGDLDLRPPGKRFPLHIEVHTILEDFRYFKKQWFELHIADFVRIQLEEREQRKQFRDYGREEQEREAKTKDAPETFGEL